MLPPEEEAQVARHVTGPAAVAAMVAVVTGRRRAVGISGEAIAAIILRRGYVEVQVKTSEGVPVLAPGVGRLF